MAEASRWNHIMRHTFIAFLITAFLAVGPAWAQSPAVDAPPPPENLAAAREVVQAMRLTDIYIAVLPTLFQALKPLIIQAGRTEEDFNTVLPALNRVALAHVNELAEAMAAMYARHYSVNELHDITAFYRTPTGQKVATQQPKLAPEAAAVGQQWAIKLRPELVDAINAELLKRAK
jgi:uncharacterized protein